jgi:hypothetical protein
MNQKTLDMTRHIQEPSSNRTRAGWAWSVAIALTLALTVISGRQFDALSPLTQAALSDYLTALGADELSPLK